MKNQKIKQDEVSFDSLQAIEVLNNSLSEFKYGEQKLAKYWVESVDEEYVYLHDQEDEKEYRAKYTIKSEDIMVHLDKKEEMIKSEYKVARSEDVQDIAVSVNENNDVDAIVALFEDEEEACDILKAEFGKEDKEKDFAVIINTIYLKVKSLFEKNKEFALSNVELQKFKDDILSFKGVLTGDIVITPMQ